MRFAVLLSSLVALILGSQFAMGQTAGSPPELMGYEFFNDSRLSSLKFYASTAKDVKKAMGAECEHHCDFNDQWQVSFSYVGSNWSTTDSDGKTHGPRPELVGTLDSIGFRPIKPVILPEGTLFPTNYRCDHGITQSGKLEFASHVCLAQGSMAIMYSIVDENKSDGKDLVLKNQVIIISYGPPLKARGIFLPFDK